MQFPAMHLLDVPYRQAADITNGSPLHQNWNGPVSNVWLHEQCHRVCDMTLKASIYGQLEVLYTSKWKLRKPSPTQDFDRLSAHQGIFLPQTKYWLHSSILSLHLWGLQFSFCSTHFLVHRSACEDASSVRRWFAGQIDIQTALTAETPTGH